MGISQELYKKAKKMIPGGTQLLSKRPEMFLPDLWPAYYRKAEGCEISDLDGNRYIDMSYMGIGTCALGYADKDVNRAVHKAIESGTMSTLNSPDEVKLAELLIRLHPWAGMVRYARSGGEAMAIAVRIGRAISNKDVALFCGYHGWHDWYLSANLTNEGNLEGHLLPGLDPKGVPKCLMGTAYPFTYNNTREFLGLVKQYKKNIGVVVIESIRNVEPEKEFIEVITETTGKLGVILIVDEISAGWRLTLGGAHLLFGLEPDLAVFAKGMSNGFPMAAVIGKKHVMEVAQETFISSTYWTERIGPAAALATIQKMEKRNVSRHLIETGKVVQEGWQDAASRCGLKIEVGGIYPLSHFAFKYEEPLILKTLFTQLMLERGFLATTAFYASYAHKKQHTNKYLLAVNDVFHVMSKAIKRGHPERYLKGPVCHSGFKRLT